MKALLEKRRYWVWRWHGGRDSTCYPLRTLRREPTKVEGG